MEASLEMLAVMEAWDSGNAVRETNAVDLPLAIGNFSYFSLVIRAGAGKVAGRVWVNCYHLCPAHASFGGYKNSGLGKTNCKDMLDHYRNAKNILVSYSKNALGFF